MKIYTKTGDGGKTGLLGGERVSKRHPRIKALGDLDELNCSLGLVLSRVKPRCPDSALALPLSRIQNDLFELGALTADQKTESKAENLEVSILNLEKDIDEMTESLEVLKNFILPGGSETAARLFYARAVCRRAERSLCEINEENPALKNAVIYLNRLSDYLFTAARWTNKVFREPETSWKRPSP